MTSKYSLSRRSALCALALSLFTAAPMSAAYTWRNVQLGGFISQGYLESDNNNYPVQTQGGTFDFREYGLNASTTFGTHLRVGGQIFGQTLGEYGDDKPTIDWAQVDYNFAPQFGVRAGRVKYPRSLYSEVLDLDMLRPFVFLPQSIYDNRLRDFQASFDGAMIYGSIEAGRSSFDYKIFYGDIPMKSGSGVEDYNRSGGMFAAALPVKSSVELVGGVALTWNTPIAGLRFGATYSKLRDLDTSGGFAAVPSMSASTSTNVEYTGVSAEYSLGPWTFASEAMISESTTAVAPPPTIAPSMTVDARIAYGYASVARRLGEKFEVGTYYTKTWNTKANSIAAPTANERADWAFAVRYDVNEHLLFKVEVHAITGNKDFFNTPGVSNPPGALERSTTLIAAKTTISF